MSAITRDTVLAAFARHIGEAEGVSARDLVGEIAGLFAVDADERRLRSVIEELRREGMHICGHPSTGYYLAANDDELQRTCNFLFERSITGLEQIAAMQKVSLPDLRGQLRLRL